MTRLAGMLLEATERDVGDGEDRLTEILAAVLAGVPSLAGELLRLTELPAGDSYEISTQLGRGGKRIDMQVLAFVGGRVVSRLWGEHKIDAEFGAAQIANYLKLLGRERAGESAIALIVPSDRLRALRQRVIVSAAAPVKWLSWQDVAIAAVRVARRTGGRNWERAALEPDAAASQLLLAELVGALERRELAHVDPFSVTDVFALSNFSESRDALWAVFDRAPQHFERLAGTTNRSRRSGDFTGWWHVLEGSSSWAGDEFGGWPEYFVRDDDWWRGDERAMEAPCFVAGYSFEAQHVVELLGEDIHHPWRDRLAEQGIDLFEDGQYVRCARVLYFNELVTAGVTLDDQAAALADWIETTVALIDDRPPLAGPRRRAT